MKNAYFRFGALLYQRVGRKSSTQIRVTVDRYIGEPMADGRSSRAHLVSLFGTDTAVAALHAAIMAGERLIVEAPGGGRVSACLGQHAECYRGSLPLPDGGRPLRHLIAVSEELARSGAGEEKERTILPGDGDEFVWSSLAARHGLPASAEWATWIMAELRRQRRIIPLTGIGCDPVLVKASRNALLAAISRGLRRGALVFPENNGAVAWPAFDLGGVLQQRF